MPRSKKQLPAATPPVENLTNTVPSTTRLNQTSASPAPGPTSTLPPAANPSILQVKPFTDETLKDPAKWAEWLFSHSPDILAEIFRTLPAASPGDRLKTLQALFNNTITYKPLIPPTGTTEDSSSILKQLLEQTHEQEN